MTLAHQKRKIERAATTAAPDRDIIESKPESVASGKKKKEDDGNKERNQKRKKAIEARI